MGLGQEATGTIVSFSAAEAQRWFPRLGATAKTRVEAQALRLRLICWPFAGGSAASFAAWPEALSAAVEVRALQLPGRASRIAETPLRNITQLRAYLLAALAHFDDLPLVFFGHSKGALLAYDVAYHGSGPWRERLCHFIISAKPAPHLPPLIRRQDMPDQELMDELGRFGGTPPELLAHREFMAMILPMIRADFALVENYADDCSPMQAPTVQSCGAVASGRALPGCHAINLPVNLWWGSEDRQAQANHVQAWRPYFQQVVEECEFAGGHFYLGEVREAVLAKLNHILNAQLIRRV